VYYSYTGNTEIIAKTLAQELNADILKIEDVERPSVLKAYILGTFAARKGKSWPIKSINTDLSKYNRIFVGAPIWCGKTSPELNTFIDQTDFSGKSVVIFVSMAGSNPDMAIKALDTRISARGGKIISSFSIKTVMSKKNDIELKSKDAAQQYK
ncbi:MAG: flavodoxin domain-containing protein, partial [Elusimicrobia bacterium]|nr:flavodoxin domain-containing protein [Elusimicrobiota bacterium]